MKINLSGTKEAGEKQLLPAGEYLATIIEVEERESSRDGSEYYNIQYQIIDDEYKGTIIYDNIFFTQAALPRLKKMLKELGFDVEKPIDLTPELLVGRNVVLKIEIVVERSNRYLDENGNPKEEKKNKVAFAGFRKVTDDENKLIEKAKQDLDIYEDIPF